MKVSKVLLTVTAALACAFLFGGCYTKIASYQNDTMPVGSAARKTCSDCQQEVAASNMREVCVWERDLFGFPEMRCYTTNYASSWMYFHNTPWWYRNSYGWYDNRGCPAYYYYDRTSGICRYYGGTYHRPRDDGKGGGSGGGMTPGTQPPRRGLRGEIAQPTYGGSGMFSGGARQLSPTSAPSSSSSSADALSKPQESSQSAPTSEKFERVRREREVEREREAAQERAQSERSQSPQQSSPQKQEQQRPSEPPRQQPQQQQQQQPRRNTRGI